jgi:hypothetical protein
MSLVSYYLMVLSRAQIINIINSEELLEFVKQRILPIINNDVETLRPRVELEQIKENYAIGGPIEIIDDNGQTIKIRKPYDFNFYKHEGVIAGGSLCNLINEYIYQVPAVINDVDFFHYELDSTTDQAADAELYSNLVNSDLFHYEVVNTTELGLLNKIFIRLENDFAWLSLLESFDLNCCQVALNLNENRFYITDEFIDFLEKRVIELTPKFENDYHLTTYVRGVAKAQETKSKFYIMELLNSYLASNLSEVVFKNHGNRVKLSTKLSEIAGDEQFITPKRFKWLKAHPEVFLPLFKLDGDDLIVQSVTQFPWASFIYDIHEYVQRFQPVAYDSEYNSKPERILKLIGYLGVSKEARSLKFYTQNVKFYSRFFTILKSNLFLNPFDLFRLLKQERTSLFKSDFSIKELESLGDFLKQHEDYAKFSVYLAELGYGIQDIIDFFKRVKNQSLTNIGIIEVYFLFKLEKDSQSTKVSREHYAKIDGFIQNKTFGKFFAEIDKIYDSQLQQNTLCQPIPIQPYQRFVREITTSDELVREGKKLHHCVGGYGYKIKDGDCRIFHIQTLKGVSTLEVLTNKKKAVEITREDVLKMSKKARLTLTEAEKANVIKLKTIRAERKLQKTEFKIKQHKSHHNSAPSKVNDKIAKRLVDYLNKKCA